jgi:hypothetical protein
MRSVPLYKHFDKSLSNTNYHISELVSAEQHLLWTILLLVRDFILPLLLFQSCLVVPDTATTSIVFLQISDVSNRHKSIRQTLQQITGEVQNSDASDFGKRIVLNFVDLVPRQINHVDFFKVAEGSTRNFSDVVPVQIQLTYRFQIVKTLGSDSAEFVLAEENLSVHHSLPIDQVGPFDVGKRRSRKMVQSVPSEIEFRQFGTVLEPSRVPTLEPVTVELDLVEIWHIVKSSTVDLFDRIPLQRQHLDRKLVEDPFLDLANVVIVESQRRQIWQIDKRFVLDLHDVTLRHHEVLQTPQVPHSFWMHRLHPGSDDDQLVSLSDQFFVDVVDVVVIPFPAVRA